MWWLNEESQQVLNRGYLLKGETVQDAVERIVTKASSYYNGQFKEEFRELIERGYMSLSSPIWSNCGTQRGLPISCFNVHVPDSIEGITTKTGEVIMQTKIGGGTSGYFGELRGRGASITDNGKSSGAVSFMELFNTSMNVVSQGSCYQEGTKVLTQRGYVDFREVKETDLLSQVDEHNKVSFTKDYELVVNPFKGELVKIKGKKRDDLVNIGVTPNHRMVIERRKGTRKNGKYWAGNTEIVKAEDLRLHRDNRMFFAGNTELKGRGLTTEERFMIAFQADGRKDYKCNTARFRFKKERKIERLIEIVENLGVRYETKVEKNGVTNIYVYNSEHLKKEFLDWIDLSQVSLQWCEEFIEEISLWDGSKNKNRTSIYYSSIHEQNVNMVQSIASICGKRTRLRTEENREGNRKDLYSITISDINKIQGDSCEIYREDYDGNVYCAVVPKGRLIVSFEGRTLVCGNTRRGAFAAYLDIDHPDIEEFLKIKSIGHTIQNLFYGVCIPDYWMQEMEAGDMEKREIWAKVLESRQEKGLPYLFFTDNVNRNKPEIYKKTNSKVNASNLCVSPNTLILTKDGYNIIKDFEDKKVEVWNGEEWSETMVKKTNTNQTLYKVKTNSGYELDCTGYHKFYIQEDYSKKSIKEVRAIDLKKGDKLIKFDLPLIEGYLDLSNTYVNGFYSGDGCLTREGQRIYLYHEKRDLINKFDLIDKWTIQEDSKRIYGHTDKLKDKYFVPNSEYTIESRLKWLAGYLDADGCVCDNNGSQTIQIASVEKEFLKEIQLMLQTLGCDSKITFNRNEGEFLLPKNDGSGELDYYNCKEINRLLINGNSLFKLSQLGLKCERLRWEVKKPQRESSQFIKIESVEVLEGLHDTYCFTEPKRNMGMFNGILTGQCSEIALPSNEDESFVCCLASMNLALYNEWKDTKAVKYAIYFLDAIMSEFIEKTKGKFGLKQAHNFAKRHRALGLGVLGYHSYLQKNNIAFSDGMRFNNESFALIERESKKASKELGEMLGYAPIFDEVEGIEKYRNTTTMAIAPTTSSSAILGQVSAGIEPYSSNYYKAGLSKGNFMRKNKYLQFILKEKGLDNEDTWRKIMLNGGSVQGLSELSDAEKAVFMTFKEINQRDILNQAVSRQRYIDQSQSLNINIPSDIPIKEVNKLILDFWKSGGKTLYYQRSQSVSKELITNLVSCSSCES